MSHHLFERERRSVAARERIEGMEELADKATWRAVIVALLLLQDVAQLLRLIGRNLFTGHFDLSAQASVAATAEGGS